MCELCDIHSPRRCSSVAEYVEYEGGWEIMLRIQVIAKASRPTKDKESGVIVDYWGLSSKFADDLKRMEVKVSIDNKGD